LQSKLDIKVEANIKHFGGVLKTVSHWSQANNCVMKFKIFLPDDSIKLQRGNPYPVLYFLAGLTCTIDNAPTKSNFGMFAAKHKICMVFPDTSPRGVEIEGI
jgi:S-formylglutathione hydrolase